jgi:type 1 glutamine amidotransferase
MTAINKTAKELPQLPVGLVEQLASFVNTEQALRLITNQLMKQVVERTLQAELSHQIDSATGNANSRHGFMADNLKPVLGFPVEYMC